MMKRGVEPRFFKSVERYPWVGKMVLIEIVLRLGEIW